MPSRWPKTTSFRPSESMSAMTGDELLFKPSIPISQSHSKGTEPAPCAGEATEARADQRDRHDTQNQPLDAHPGDDTQNQPLDAHPSDSTMPASLRQAQRRFPAMHAA